MAIQQLDLATFDLAHARRVANLTFHLACQSGLPVPSALCWHKAAFYHDCGKVFLPDGLLNKPGKLSDKEYRMVKCHTWLGACLLQRQGFCDDALLIEVALLHHERLDGSGYYGLKDGALRPAIRLIALADVFDAMTHDRSYHLATSALATLDYLNDKADTLFDRQYVSALTALLQE